MWSRSFFADNFSPAAIGMVHLQPLPGAPGWSGDLARVKEAALLDAERLVTAGLNALMIENYQDIPFYPGSVPPETVAAMTVLASALRDVHPQVKLGVNVLRNDVESALAVALATGAHFVRVNVHVGAAVTDQGSIEGRAWHTLRRRRELGCEQIGILADVRVKHARPLVERSLVEEAQDLRLRGLADAVIVTGAATGSGADAAELASLRAGLPNCPLLVGSGMTAANVGDFFPLADGCIIGSSLKAAGADGVPVVSVDKATDFLRALAAVNQKG